MENLEHEVNYFHCCLFGYPAPARLVNLYVDFNEEHFDRVSANSSDTRTVEIIIAKRLDAVGIEKWLRRKGLRHLLSRKLMLIMYLAECDSAHPDFRVCISGPFYGCIVVVRALSAAVRQLFVGRIQIALYALL